MQFYNVFFRGFAPFISSRPKVIKKIMLELEKIGLPQNACVYELGCGRAGFLCAVRDKYPQAKLVGVEYSFLPFIIAEIQNNLTRARLILLRMNFLKVDLHQADIIYCYLNRQSMLNLEEKFSKNLKKGAWIISYAFPVPKRMPKRVVQIGEHNENKVYFYKV